MSAAWQGAGRMAGRRRRKTAQPRPIPMRGLTPFRDSRIAFPPRGVLKDRFFPDIRRGNGPPWRCLPPPGARGKSSIAYPLFLPYIQEWLSCNWRAVVENGKAIIETVFYRFKGCRKYQNPQRKHRPVSIISTMDSQDRACPFPSNCRAFPSKNGDNIASFFKLPNKKFGKPGRFRTWYNPRMPACGPKETP